MFTPKLGITLSQSHLEHLNIPIDLAIQESLKHNFAHIRIGAYWNQIEISPGGFDFSKLQYLLSKYEQANQPVVLTLGVKAPRWPEYYWPDFIVNKDPKESQTQQQILTFIKQVIHVTKSFKCITHWQVENEPFDPSGPNNLLIPHSLLEQEIKLVKSLDSRPVIVTCWGNDLLSRGGFHQAEQLADELGVDLYFKQFITQVLGKNIYRGPAQTDKKLIKFFQSCPKPVWITELQAEPWEKDETGYMSDQPQSISPNQLKANIERARKLPVKEILLWGFEYWLWQSQKGNDSYFDAIK